MFGGWGRIQHTEAARANGDFNGARVFVRGHSLLRMVKPHCDLLASGINKRQLQ